MTIGRNPPKPSKRARGPGRPAQNDADLRERLLDAALACYVAEGIKAASLKSIARQAGVTPALVHYYFGNKDLLFAAVIEERLMLAMAALQGGLDPGDGTPGALVRGFATALHAVVGS